MRKPYLDHIRCSVVLLVVLYHIVYMFNSVGVITNVEIPGIPQMDALLYLVYPWFMFCLFVVAGVSAKCALQNKTNGQFIKARAKKLLLPSVAGIFLIGWIGGYVTSRYADMFAGQGDMIPGVVKYFVYCMAGIGPLWFAHELFLASLALVLLRVIDKKDRLWELGGKVNLPALVLLFFPVWGSAQILNTPLIEVYRNGFYIFGFLLGYYVFSHEHTEEILKKYCLFFLAAAVVIGVAYTYYYWGQNYSEARNLRSLLTNLYAWFATLAVIGCGKAWFDRESRFTAYMRPRSFGFYVLHYPLLVSVAYLADFHTQLEQPFFYLVLLAAAVVLLPLLYEAASRIPVVRTLLLGMGKVRKADGSQK